jgi:hypothetical protein
MRLRDAFNPGQYQYPGESTLALYSDDLNPFLYLPLSKSLMDRAIERCRRRAKTLK